MSKDIDLSGLPEWAIWPYDESGDTCRQTALLQCAVAVALGAMRLAANSCADGCAEDPRTVLLNAIEQINQMGGEPSRDGNAPLLQNLHRHRRADG